MKNNQSPPDDFLIEVAVFEFLIHVSQINDSGDRTFPTYNKDLVIRKNQHTWDYKEFLVEINGIIDPNSYEFTLNELFEEFIKNHDKRILKKYSKSDCYDLLISEILILSELEEGFYSSEDPDTNNQGVSKEPIRKLLGHLKCNEKILNNYGDTNRLIEIYPKIEIRISSYLGIKKAFIAKAIKFLHNKLEWLNYTRDEINVPQKAQPREAIQGNSLVWKKSDTDLLELITALMEIKAINNIDHNLTRKDAIEIFSKVFGREIKDAESKLSRATERKKDISPFLSLLKESFDNYAIRKEQK